MIKTLAAAALAAFVLAAPAQAQEQTAPPAVQSGFDIAQLNPQVREAVEAARAAEAEAERAAERARGQARSGERARGQNTTNGAGYYELSGGATYAGGLSNSQFDGFGVYSFAEGSTLKYEGAFEAGQMHGHGIYYWRAGSRFAGQRDEGVRKGFGVHHFADGRRYEGAWENDARHGPGVEWTADGRVAGAGIWTNNALATPLAP